MEGQSNSDTHKTPAKQSGSPLGQFLKDNFKNLSKFERFFFDYGSVIVSSNSFACGLMAHNLFRKTLKLRKGFLFSALPVTIIPVMFTGIYHELLVTQPLIEGSLTCLVCAQVRSSYIGLFMGGVAPILLAAYVNLMMVPSVLRTPVQKGGLIREMVNFTKPVFGRLKYFLLFEVAFSTAVASKQYDTIGKLLQLPLVAETQETRETLKE